MEQGKRRQVVQRGKIAENRVGFLRGAEGHARRGGDEAVDAAEAAVGEYPEAPGGARKDGVKITDRHAVAEEEIGGGAELALEETVEVPLGEAWCVLET